MARPNPEMYNPGGFRSITDTGGNTVTDYAVPSPSRAIYRRDWSGSVTPGFSSMSPRQKAKLTTLAHTSNITSVRASECVQTEIYRHTTGVNAGKTFYRTTRWDSQRSRDLLSVCSLGTADEATAKAIARLADEVRGAKVNLAQNFAERRQVANMATTNAFRIAAAAFAMKRGDRKSFQDALRIGVSRKGWAVVERDPASKRLANHWLEYKFGWVPLLSDIHDSADLLAKHFSSDRTHHTATGSASHTQEENWTTYNGNTATRFNATYVTRVKYGVSYRADSAALQILSSTGISNPALLAWELLPYSFVVDWFIPVGNYLDSLNAFAGMTFVDGYKMTYRTASSTCSRFGRSNELWTSPYWYSTEFAGNVSCMKRGLSRVRLTAYPNIPLPDFKDPIGGDALGRFATAAALIRQAFK